MDLISYVVLPWLVSGRSYSALHNFPVVLAAFILPIRIYLSYLAHEFILMSFLLHKVTFIHASLAAVFQLQRSKAVTDLSAQS